MQLSMYQASVPVFIRGLNNLAAILDKAQAHAEARGIDPLVLPATRLYPDMFPLTMQVRIAGDTAKGAAARLAGVDPERFEDTETTLPELAARLRRTVELLNTFGADRIDGSEGREVVLKMRSGALTFTGADYLLTHALPNFYFHISMAYAILRQSGVELGKQDFLGRR